MNCVGASVGLLVGGAWGVRGACTGHRVLPSANVPRPAASSLISLRGVPGALRTWARCRESTRATRACCYQLPEAPPPLLEPPESDEDDDEESDDEDEEESDDEEELLLHPLSP